MYTKIGTFYSLYMTVCCAGPGDNRQSSKNKEPIVVYIRLHLLMMSLETPETCRG